eukprot:scaffold168694_cov17-Tisochrysis_lutea.AAC.1
MKPPTWGPQYIRVKGDEHSQYPQQPGVCPQSAPKGFANIKYQGIDDQLPAAHSRCQEGKLPCTVDQWTKLIHKGQ